MTRFLSLSTLICFCWCASVQAQDAGQNQQPSAEGSRPVFHRSGNGGPQKDGEYVQKWLETVKQRNPEEFERMRKLLEDNPEEFRRQLHQKLQDMRNKGGFRSGSLQEHPRVAEALQSLPPEDREWAMQRLLQPPSMPGSFGGHNRGDGFLEFKHIMTPEIAKGEARARELTTKYREARSDSEKNSIKVELRDAVTVLFDLREKARAEQIRQIEEKSAKIHKQLEERQAGRSKLIEDRLEEMLRADPKSR